MRSIIYVFNRFWVRTVWTLAVINCLDITWSSSFKKKLNYISVQFSLKTLTHHSSFIQKTIFCKTKFFTSNVTAEDCWSESRETVCLFKKFDEMTRWFDLMRWRRFRQVWWVAFVIWWDDVFFIKFDESLSSDLMSRSQRIWWDVLSSLMTSHHKRRSTSRE